MDVPSCVQATCTAVKDETIFPAASLTTITPPCTKDDPTPIKFEARSTVKLALTAPDVPPELLLLQAPMQTAQAASTGADKLPKNVLLSIVDDCVFVNAALPFYSHFVAITNNSEPDLAGIEL